MSSNGAGAQRRLGIVGAGKAGTAFARAAVAGGYDVAISGSGPAERIELIVEVLAPGARALTTEEVVKYADLIVLAIPLHRFREFRRELFAGKILVDAMNYWDEIDGVDGPFATAPAGPRGAAPEGVSESRVGRRRHHNGPTSISESQTAHRHPPPR